MTAQPDTTLPLAPEGYVEYEGDWYPAEQLGLDGRPLPISEEVAGKIAEILREQYETNERYREAVNARLARRKGKRGAA